MAKTFNRRPLQVNTPSSNDVKNYFFNHCNWKGINKDKNFLTIDQETFADAKNVYIDAEGLLKSRPSVKRKTMFFDSAIDFWNFDDVDVYLRKDDTRNKYFLVAVNDNKTAYTEYMDDRDFKLVRIENKIYVFSKNHFLYIDVNEMTFEDAFEKIYIPNTTYEANGAKTKIESKNLLTNKEKHTYLYNMEFGVANEAYNKELTVKLNDKTYDFVFDEYTPELITDVLFKVPDSYDDVVVSNNGTYLFFSKERRLVSYSVTGEVISKNFVLPDSYGEIITKPKFSYDSNYAIIGTDKSIYIVSLVADSSTGIIRYPEFTQIIPDGEFPLSPLTITGMDFDFSTYDKFSCLITYNDEDGMGLGQAELFYSSDEGLKTYYPSGIKINPKVVNLYSQQESFKDGYLLIGNAFKGVHGYEEAALLVYLYNPNFETPLVQLYDSSVESRLMDVKTFENEIVFLERADTTSIVHTLFVEDGVLKGRKYEYATNNVNEHLLFSDGSKIFMGDKIYYRNNDLYKDLIAKDTYHSSVFYGDYLYYLDTENNLFSTLIKDDLEFNYLKDGVDNLLDITIINRLDNFYLASGKTLYVTKYREEDGEFRWYLPETYKQTFDKTITGLQPISSSEMGVFFDDEIWYVHKNEDVYYSTKTKLELGIKFGSDITISYDGTRLIFPTERGIVALSYQDFVASTDQILTFLSDAIHLEIKDFCKQPVLLFKSDYWIFVYRKNSNEFYVLDSRNNSWWFWSLSNKIKKFVKYDDEALILSSDGTFHKFSESNENYFDYDGKKHTIDWYVTSQKLHLSQINIYKHLVNITLNSVIDTETYFTFFLDVTNYRKTIDGGKTENISYTIERLRTYIQRLNYFKVNEFQYTLRSDNENKHPLPLSLSSIGIKYKIQGQVR